MRVEALVTIKTKNKLTVNMVKHSFGGLREMLITSIFMDVFREWEEGEVRGERETPLEKAIVWQTS